MYTTRTIYNAKVKLVARLKLYRRRRLKYFNRLHDQKDYVNAMRAQRVLVLVKLFWPEGGGAELATYLIVRDILSKYFDVIVMSGTEKPKDDILRCCKYIYWSVLKTMYKPVEWLKLLANAKTIRKLVEQVDAIYIPSHTLLPLAIIAKLIKPDIKVILHLHNYQPLTYTSVVLAGREPDLTTDIIVERGEHGSLLRALASGLGHYMNKVNILSLYFADKIICVSRRQYEILIKYVPTIHSKVAVIYNPLPQVPNINKKLSDCPTILFSGGGSFVKGFDIIVKAISRIATKHPCRIYITYGREASVRQSVLLRKLASKLHGKLVILGRIPYEKLTSLHELAWAALFPSIYEEPLPYAIMESCLLGTVPIASRVGGVPEIVQGTYAEGLMFTPGDAEEMADRVEEVLSLSKEQLIGIGCKLRETALKRFNSEATKRQLLKVLGI